MGRGEFDSGMKVVEVGDEGVQIVLSVSPDHENVVDETPPGMWLVWCTCKCVCLEFSEE